MKKYFFVSAISLILLISAVSEPVRFDSTENLAKALLNTFRKNDSLQFVRFSPTKEEAYAAVLNNKSDSGYAQKKKRIDSYYENNNAILRQHFRQSRQDVVNYGVSWAATEFKSLTVKNKRPGSGIVDSICNLNIYYEFNGAEIEMELKNVMKTKEGWNCGFDMRSLSVKNKPKSSGWSERRAAERMADSIHMADSIAAVYYMLEQNKKKSPR